MMLKAKTGVSLTQINECTRKKRHSDICGEPKVFYSIVKDFNCLQGTHDKIAWNHPLFLFAIAKIMCIIKGLKTIKLCASNFCQISILQN